MSKICQKQDYGCVYYPGFNCDSNYLSNTNMISKLQIYDSVAKNELFFGEIICKINNYRFYFLPVINSCEINTAKVSIKNIEHCKIINDKIDNKYILMNMEYDYNISFKNIFIDNKKSKKHRILLYIDSFKYLCLSLQKLLDNNIIHFDIKENNIVFNKKTENPLIIDFGISILIKNIIQNKSLVSKEILKKYFYKYEPTYYVWPLEVHVISYLLHESPFLNNDSIKVIVSNYVNNNKALNIFSEVLKNDYFNICVKYLSKYIKYSDTAIIQKLISFCNTWDMYSLSIIYLKYLRYLFFDGFINNSFTTKISQILLINIHPNPDIRINPTDSNKQINDLLYMDNNSKSYQKLIDNFNDKNISDYLIDDPVISNRPTF